MMTVRLKSLPADLVRFGITPRKIARRIWPDTECPRVVCNCLPKSGTHLIERALSLHPRLYRKLLPTIRGRNCKRLGGMRTLCHNLRPGQALITHLHCRPEYLEVFQDTDAHAIFLIRDPRDVFLSLAHFMTTHKSDRMRDIVARLGKNLPAIFRLLIEGDEEGNVTPFPMSLESYAGWLESDVHLVRFEDLIGAHGGGSDEVQAESLDKLYRYLGVPLAPERIAALQNKLFSAHSPTFRKGAIGQWREHIPKDILQEFHRVCGRWIDLYGYGDAAPVTMHTETT
jgi:hypothetical protein